jgi:hypothetical protein
MIDYHLDLARSIVVTRAAGKITAGELSAYLVRLMRDPQFQADLNALILVNDVNTVPNKLEAGLIAPLIRAWSKRRAGVRWAFVLPNQPTRDVVESLLVDAHLTAVIARCFLAESAALAWLEATIPAAPTKA